MAKDNGAMKTYIMGDSCPKCGGCEYHCDNCAAGEFVALHAIAEATRVLLDQVDYMAGNCRPNEMVGAVLSRQVIALVRDALNVGTVGIGKPVNNVLGAGEDNWPDPPEWVMSEKERDG